MSETLTENKVKGEEVRVQCAVCDGITKHKVLASADIDGEDPDSALYWSRSYQLIQCGGCEDVSFRKVATHSEDYDIDQDGIQYFESVELYPRRMGGRKGLGDDVWLLPERVRQIYEETLSSHLAGLPVVTGIGIRALIEAIARSKEVKGRTLFEQIDNLRDMHVLTPAGARILHHIRSLGNAAAHEAEPHTSAELNTAMDVAEHLLRDVYVFPKKAASVFEKQVYSPSYTFGPPPERKP